MRTTVLAYLVMFVVALGCGETARRTAAPVSEDVVVADSAAPEPIDSSGTTVYGYALRLEGFGVMDGDYGVLASKSGSYFEQPYDGAFSAPYYETASLSAYYSAAQGGAVSGHVYAVNGRSHLPKSLGRYDVEWELACIGVGTPYGGFINGETTVTWMGVRHVFPSPPDIVFRDKQGGATLTVGLKSLVEGCSASGTAFVLDLPGRRRASFSHMEYSGGCTAP